MDTEARQKQQSSEMHGITQSTKLYLPAGSIEVMFKCEEMKYNGRRLQLTIFAGGEWSYGCDFDSVNHQSTTSQE